MSYFLPFTKLFDTLTEKQKSRVVKYYVKDKTLRDIAEEENVKYQTINESLEEAIKKLKNFFKTP